MAPTVVSIGTFDGAHVGHAALVSRARVLAGASSARVVVYAFDPHPLSVLRPEAAPARLSTFEHRRELLQSLGAAEVYRLEPTPSLLDMSAEEFVEDLVSHGSIAAFVEGASFRFGKGRAGDVGTLAELGARLGFGVELVPSVTVALSDQSIVTASSSLVRWLLAHGRVRDAAIVLGRDYEVWGTVVSGDGRGRGLGFPTANIETPCMIPADGIYAGEARLADGRRFPAAISVGTKPTFGASSRTLEALLLEDARETGEAAPAAIDLAYDWPIRVRFTSFLRDQVRYSRVEALIEQMRLDCQDVMLRGGACATPRIQWESVT